MWNTVALFDLFNIDGVKQEDKAWREHTEWTEEVGFCIKCQFPTIIYTEKILKSKLQTSVQFLHNQPNYSILK